MSKSSHQLNELESLLLLAVTQQQHYCWTKWSKRLQCFSKVKCNSQTVAVWLEQLVGQVEGMAAVEEGLGDMEEEDYQLGKMKWHH